MRHRVYPAPPATYLLIVDDDGRLVAVHQEGPIPPSTDIGERDDSVAAAAAAQLDEYFAGKRTVFDLELAPQGTPFQLAVWQQIAAIPFGETRTYGEIAAALGSAPRAVGGACGQNPHAVIVPCHRVLGAGGRITGYSGGLDTKEWLLSHEEIEFRR